MAAIAVHSRKFIMQIAFVLLILYCTFSAGKDSKKGAGKEKDNKIGKDVLDYNERDVHKLLDQWDENDEDMDEDDKYDDHDPRKPKKPVPFNPAAFKGDAADLLKMSKKNQVVMIFVSIAGNPTRKKAEVITSRWQTSLHNAHYQVERYMVADDRALFLLKDGSMAWDVKNFLVTQADCKTVEFDNQKFPCAGASKSEKTEL